MSQLMPDSNLTESFLCESMPEFFSVSSESDIPDAFAGYMSHVGEVAGPRGEDQSVFDWEKSYQLVDDITTEAGRDARILALHISQRAGNLCLRLDAPKRSFISTTQVGSLITVDGQGHIKASSNEPNPEVDPSYGDPTHYVLEKLGWAKVAEVLTGQGGDWGEGYKVLTEYLRSIGRLGSNDLPHVGMATVHEIPFDEVAWGTDRNALAYSSASNFTLMSSSVGDLLKDPRFFSLYERDLNMGRFTNISDWLAGRLDSLVAANANGLYLGKETPNIFPYLDTPDYIDVDNN